MSSASDATLSTQEAAERLRVDARMVRELIRQEVLKAEKIGRDWRIRRDSLPAAEARLKRTRGKGGRTPTGRSKQVCVKMTEEEFLRVKDTADYLGLTEAAWMRQAALLPPSGGNATLTRAAEREIWKQIAGVGRNVNQIAHRVNRDGAQQLRPGELERLREEVHGAMAFVRQLAGKE